MLGASLATGCSLDKIIADVRKNFSKKLRAEVVEANVQAVGRTTRYKKVRSLAGPACKHKEVCMPRERDGVNSHRRHCR